MKTKIVVSKLDEISKNSNLSKEDQSVIGTAAGLLKDYETTVSNVNFILETYEDPVEVVAALRKE
ncbi:hypothetical protein [Enterococcus hulanensis]|uniref:hypothetical protein n=1 Tax=Enterococcus hulanensis TaxID=2559929 RepID=UPI0010F59A4F|nr:hypothetical protein [Enterococcus hulanensis]